MRETWLPKREISLTWAVLISLCASVAMAAQAPGEPPTEDGPPEGMSSPRELLELFDIGESFFSSFADDRPLEPAEREKLRMLLYRLRQIPPLPMYEFRKPTREVGLIAADPARYRGDVFSLRGFVKYVARVELEPPLREKLEIESCYRCQIATLLGAEVTLYTLAVPAAWKLDEPIEEHCGALAMFVKVLAPPQGNLPAKDDTEVVDPGQTKKSFLFISQRVAWYGGGLLGDLGMDMGLLDDVRDRSGLDERECFYQMLAAVHRARTRQLDRAGRAHLDEQRDFLTRLARNRELSPKARAAAQRGLERAEQNADDVVPLFNDPAAHRGELLVLRGEALRAIEVRVDDPDVVNRFGIDHYYEVEVVTPDSQNNPIVCCVAELPPDMPQGESIHENVCVTGFFLKSWAFDSQKSSAADAPNDAQRRQQLAPLVIAKTVQVLREPAPAHESNALAVGIVIAILAGAALIWRARRADRHAMEKATAVSSLPQRIEFEQSPDDARDAARDA